MPISSKHPDYLVRSPQYQRCRDVISGSDTVKARGQEYLPPLSGQSGVEYERYKKRGLFFSVASRALSGLTGLASRRSPKLEYPPQMDKYFVDTANQGTSFNELFITMLNETMLQSRMFLLIDFPSEGGDPYILTYTAEQVINWDIIDNVLQWVVIQEQTYEFDNKDPYVRKPVTRYRRLALINGEYHVTVFNEKNKIVSDVVPTVRNVPLAFIPGFFVTPNGLNAEAVKPAMLDICDLNLKYYELMTDYMNSLHLVAVPTPIFTGAVQSETITLGPNGAIVMPEPTSKAFYLEFNGQGLQSVENALDTLMRNMALFSSRLTADTGKGSESAISVQLRYASESATLSSVVNAVQAGLTQIYNWVADFMGVPSPTVELYKQFLNTKLTATEIDSWTKAYVSGAIDKETWWNILVNGEVPVDAALKELDTPIKDTVPAADPMAIG